MSDVARMAAVADAYDTTSDKIRALDAAGYSRAEIARFLGKLYQHVRNVLVAGPPKGSPFAKPPEPPPDGFEEAAAEPYSVESGIAILRLPVGDGAAIHLPPVAMRALGLQPGGIAIAELGDEQLTIYSVRESVRRIQAMARELIPGDHSLAAALIAERREEAARDAPVSDETGREDG